MALLRRAPREVYRVFDEQDFLADGDAGDLFEPARNDAVGRPPLPRVAGVATLVGAVVAVGAMLAMHRPPTQVSGRALAPPAVGAEARAGMRRPARATPISPRARELLRAVPRRPPRNVIGARAVSFASGVHASIERSHEVAGGGSAQLEHVEFGFER
ncbi:MAG TPA: hypothetical protein VNZ01_14405 [Solirubrobacteraceae bacterium]|jgi:hypothetical protein|nr:hypothetical protein [Solirubrobacteraceae bacterium]